MSEAQTPEELAAAGKAAFERSEFEAAANAFQAAADGFNLAEDPQHAETKQRLITALKTFQQETRDPFLDQANIEEFVMEQLSNRDLSYRKNKSFRWKYLDTFRQWRENQ